MATTVPRKLDEAEAADLHRAPAVVPKHMAEVMDALVGPQGLARIQLAADDTAESIARLAAGPEQDPGSRVIRVRGTMYEAGPTAQRGGVWLAHPHILIHCCNCMHTMGKGMALTLANIWPGVAKADKQTPRGDMSKLGSFSWYCVPATGQIVVNLYGQYDFRNARTRRNCCYGAVRVGLERLFARLATHFCADDLARLRVATYWMGCHSAGGDPALMACAYQQALAASASPAIRLLVYDS